jgi:hypothetical protein
MKKILLIIILNEFCFRGYSQDLDNRDTVAIVKAIYSMIELDYGYKPELPKSLPSGSVSFIDSYFDNCIILKVKTRGRTILKQITARQNGINVTNKTNVDSIYSNTINFDSIIGDEYFVKNEVPGQCDYIVAYDLNNRVYYRLKGFKQSDVKSFVDYFLIHNQDLGVLVGDKKFMTYRKYLDALLKHLSIEEIDLRRLYYAKKTDCSCRERDRIIDYYFPYKFKLTPKYMMRNININLKEINNLYPFLPNTMYAKSKFTNTARPQLIKRYSPK